VKKQEWVDEWTALHRRYERGLSNAFNDDKRFLHWITKGKRGKTKFKESMIAEVRKAHERGTRLK